jgi:hypothetical protein
VESSQSRRATSTGSHISRDGKASSGSDRALREIAEGFIDIDAKLHDEVHALYESVQFSEEATLAPWGIQNAKDLTRVGALRKHPGRTTHTTVEARARQELEHDLGQEHVGELGRGGELVHNSGELELELDDETSTKTCGPGWPG